MWCPTCQQDVAAETDEDRGAVACCRCGTSFSSETQRGVTAEVDPAAVPDVEPEEVALLDELRPPCDAEDLDERLERARWALQFAIDSDTDEASSAALPPKLIRDRSSSTARGRKRAPSPAAARPAYGGWAMLLLGVTALVCGSVLLGWSYFGDRPDLWKLGGPIALGGQVGLVVGLVMLLDRLWSESRSTADQLSQLDEELLDLKSDRSPHDSPLVGVLPAGVFVEGGDTRPELHLADIKRQLDALALQLHEARGDSYPRSK